MSGVDGVPVGIDACRGGWVAVVLRDGAAEAHFLESTAAVAEAIPDAGLVAIDIPIGLPCVEHWPRPGEQAVREALGPRRSSLFLTPPCEALEADTQRKHRRSRADCSAGE